MKNTAKILSLGAMAACVAHVEAQANTNVVLNGGFEEGYDNWFSVSDGFAVVWEPFYSGARSMQIQSSVGPGLTGAEQVITLDQGTTPRTITMRAQGFVDGPAAEGGLKPEDFVLILTPQFTDGKFGEIVAVPYPKIEADTWKMFYLQYTPPKPVQMVRIGCQVRNLQDGNVYCDDISLAQADAALNVTGGTSLVSPTPGATSAVASPAPSGELDAATETGGEGPNLLTDPDYEFQTPNVWWPTGKGYIVQNIEQFSGQNSAEISAPVDATFSGLSQTVQLDQKVPQVIVYSGYAMANDLAAGDLDGQDMRLVLDVSYVSGEKFSVSVPMGDVTEWDWKELSGEFSPTQPVKSVSIGCGVRNLAEGSVYCDNMKVAQYPPAPGATVAAPVTTSSAAPVTTETSAPVVPSTSVSTPIPTPTPTPVPPPPTSTTTAPQPTATTPQAPCTCDPWSGFSACEVPNGAACGTGQKSRVRECSGPAEAKNDPQCQTEEYRECSIPCEDVQDVAVTPSSTASTPATSTSSPSSTNAGVSSTGTSESGSSGGSSSGAIVGAVLGTLAAVALIGGLAAWYMWRKKQTTKTMA